jgi:RimJ/RimL family protein N-acetyltransferase/CheY-like chemotaxis protein
MTELTWTQQLPHLRGQLVTVREVDASDAMWLFELLSDPAVSRFLAQPPPSAEAFAGFIAWVQGERAQGKSVCFGIVPHGLTAAVGIVQVRALEPSWFTAEWGFALGAAFWGSGVFVDAASLVADFAFQTLGAHRIEARAVTDNARGHSAIQKLGGRAEGTLRKAFRKDGRLDQQLLWSVTKDDWDQRDQSARSRVTSADAKRQIADALAATDRLIAKLPRQEPMAAPSPYPFFLTDPKSWGKAPPKRRERPRVLMVDDNPTQLDLYSIVLEEAADIDRATRGEEGYRLACSELPDLIIVDVLLPDVDGLALAKRLRDNPRTARIPIVVLTGDDAAYARAQQEPIAFSAILTKPCPANLLLGVLKAATSQS